MFHVKQWLRRGFALIDEWVDVRDVVGRMGRQFVQVVPPVLLATGDLTDMPQLLRAGGISALVVGLKTVAGLRVNANHPAWMQAAERAISSAVAAALALTAPSGGMLSLVDGATWGGVVIAAATAAVLSVTQFIMYPPGGEGADGV